MKNEFIEINEKFGIDAFRDEQRLHSLLSDLCGVQFTKERKQIRAIYECGIGKLLLSAADATDMEKQAALGKARYQMDDKLGLKQEDIDVLIECFAVVLKCDAPDSQDLKQSTVQRKTYSREENLEYFEHVDFVEDIYWVSGIKNWRQLESADDTTLNELRNRCEAKQNKEGTAAK